MQVGKTCGFTRCSKSMLAANMHKENQKFDRAI